MLEHIFGSKTRTQLLLLFFNNPDKAYFLRQLARHLKIQLNAIRREVANLLRLDILVPTKNSEVLTRAKDAAGKKFATVTARQKYYRLNKDHVLYAELRALMMRAEMLVERRLIDRILNISHPYLLVLTGYFVGAGHISTDLLFVGNVNKNKFSSVIRQYERIVHRTINYTLMSLAEYKYRHDITDKFLYDILEEKKVVVVDRLHKS